LKPANSWPFFIDHLRAVLPNGGVTGKEKIKHQLHSRTTSMKMSPFSPSVVVAAVTGVKMAQILRVSGGMARFRWNYPLVMINIAMENGPL